MREEVFNEQGKQRKEAGGPSRCLRFAGRRKPLVFASMALAVLSAAASFVPYVAIYFMIRDAVGVIRTWPPSTFRR